MRNRVTRHWVIWDIGGELLLIGYVLQVKKMMEDESFVGFCHFLTDLF